jgi:hypothetical protein
MDIRREQVAPLGMCLSHVNTIELHDLWRPS